MHGIALARLNLVWFAMARGRIKGWRRSGWLGRILWLLLIVLITAPVILLLIFRFLPLPGTPQMVLSLIEGKGAHYSWRDDIAPVLGRTVIGSEDQNFCSHYGFDLVEINRAVAAHEKNPRRRLRGASTISQQTARSLFLAYQGGWIRKGVETWLTVLEEALWPKQRILEAYLNVVDWGHGNFGAEAAAQAYFHTSAARLTRNQAARLAAILPDPSKWSASDPGPYVSGRTGTLMGQAQVVARDGLDSCIK